MKLGAKMAAHASCQKASTETWSWEQQQQQQEQVLTTPQERVALIPPQQTYTQSSARPRHLDPTTVHTQRHR
jgi:hypothetical protein